MNHAQIERAVRRRLAAERYIRANDTARLLDTCGWPVPGVLYEARHAAGLELDRTA